MLHSSCRVHYSAQMWVILPFWSFSPANSFRIQVVFDHFHYPFFKKGISVLRVFWVLNRITGQGLPCKGEAAFHSWVRLVQMLGEGCLMWVAATSQEPVEITIAGSLSTVLSPLPFLWWETLSPSPLGNKTQVCPCWGGESEDPASSQQAQSGTFLLCSRGPRAGLLWSICHGEQFQVCTRWYWEFHVMLFKIRGSAYVIWGPM